MVDDKDNIEEQHGCIVCGKIYELLVIYEANGEFTDCTVISPGGKRVPDAHRPLVACERHTPEQIKSALARHYPGRAEEDFDEE